MDAGSVVTMAFFLFSVFCLIHIELDTPGQLTEEFTVVTAWWADVYYLWESAN